MHLDEISRVCIELTRCSHKYLLTKLADNPCRRNNAFAPRRLRYPRRNADGFDAGFFGRQPGS
jgi:hypothetical protein